MTSDPGRQQTRFTLSRMMLGMLFVSLLMAATFVHSNSVFTFCAFAILAMVVWFCIDSRWRPEPSGALIGFTVPALMSLHLIGEYYAPPQTREYIEMGIIPLAVMTLVFMGGTGAWFGMLAGMVFGIVKEKLSG